MKILSLLLLSLSIARADDWPQWLGPQRDSVWRETKILTSFPDGKLPLRWKQPIGGGYAGPAVARGKVFVTDRQLEKGVSNPSDPFDRTTIKGSERVLCLDEKSGKILWQHEYSAPYSMSYPSGPRTTPLIDGDRVYTLGAEGDLFCMEVATGKIIWSKNFKKEFSIPTPLWGFSGHPLLYKDKLICLAAGTGSIAVAFHKMTGKEEWRSLTAKEPGYCPPTLIHAAGKDQLIIWHPESINSLDPDTGKVYWSEPFISQNGLSVATPRQSGNHLFLSTFYNGSVLLELDQTKPVAKKIWQSKKSSERDTTELHTIMSTPFFEKEFVYGVCSYGQVRALKAENGERLWETLKPTTGGKEVRWGNAFFVKHEDRFFIANELGDLILAKMTPEGYSEISRANLLKPTGAAAGRPVVWSHPAFANRSVYARNDEEIVCYSLEQKP